MLLCQNPRTERLREPSGIIVGDPEFTWTLTSERPGDRQTACEVEVQRIRPGREAATVWQSGRQVQQIGDELRYAGEALASRAGYRWRVRAWNMDDQPGDWSDWAGFETGVIAPDRLTAKWIAGGGALRRDFVVGSDLLRARAYVSGLGYYEFFCNGKKVSVAALAPSLTEFDRRVEYEIIDLVPHLDAGTNCAGFLLGDGWWRHDPHAERQLQAYCEIVLEYADGRIEIVRSDENWQVADGPSIAPQSDLAHQVFDGVTLDLAWLASGWCLHDAKADGWRAAHIAGEGVGELTPTLLPPVRVVETLAPREVKWLSDSLLSIDFGQNFTGWVRFRARGETGTRFIVRHAELIHSDGRLNTSTLRSAKQTDTFLLAGGGQSEMVEPRWLFHGFRYAEIEGPRDAIDVSTIEGCVIHTDLEPIGNVSTSDERLNWLFSALRWTVRSNAFSVMTDVCQRDERRGWLMDGVTGLKAGTLFYDMDTLGRKWVVDMLDNQEPDGSLRGDTAPLWFPCRSLAWQRAIVLLPVKLYEMYGDRAALKHAFPAMRRYADFLLANLKEDLVPPGFSRHPAEWLCVGRRHDQLADNALAIDLLRKVVEAGQILCDTDLTHYAEAAERMAAASHRRWYSANSDCYGGGDGFAQSSQVYALRFGITPPAERQAVFDRLLDDIENARGEGPFVTTGIGSTEHLPIVLSEFGRDDLVWKWLQRDAYPGYGFMHKHGATAIWERWEQMTYHEMNAHNHTGLTGIGTWLMQYLVGIRVKTGSEPVFHLRPAVHLPLEWMEVTWQSRWGEVLLAWKTVDGQRRLTIGIPPGCAGHLVLPREQEVRRLLPGRHEIDC